MILKYSVVIFVTRAQYTYSLKIFSHYPLDKIGGMINDLNDCITIE